MSRQPISDCCISGHQQHVAGTLKDASLVRIAVWEVATSELAVVLQAQLRYNCIGLEWHPTQPHLLSLTYPGAILLWTKLEHDEWTSFAPTFQ